MYAVPYLKRKAGGKRPLPAFQQEEFETLEAARAFARRLAEMPDVEPFGGEFLIYDTEDPDRVYPIEEAEEVRDAT